MTFKERLQRDDNIPDAPGVYAFFLSSPDILKPIEVDISKPLYIGMTKSSLRERNHREHKTSSFSTFRRSLGAILKMELRPYRSGKPSNYRFTDAGEKKLTAWMNANLTYSYEIVAQDIVEQRESELISEFKPPLNLTKWPNPQRGKLKNLRKRFQDQAAHGAQPHTEPKETKATAQFEKTNIAGMIVAGVMSGTSADGIDVALTLISPPRTKGGTPRVKLLAHAHHPYPKTVRAAVLSAMNGEPTTTADLSRLNWRLGQLYADAVEATAAQFKLKPALVGLHGQTLYHQATAAPYLGAPTRATWQTGEPSVVAERLHCPVASDFRPADLAAGGQGAPLVPMLDYCLFRSPTKNRILLNLGGIANVTVLPAACTPQHVLAFDTGPGNMLVDALMQRLFRKPFDKDGKSAARGKFDGIGFFDPYLQTPPPKSCGREQFGSEFADRFIASYESAETGKADIIAAATWLTPLTITDAISRFCIPHLTAHAPHARTTEVVAAGGGIHNAFLMEILGELLGDLQIKLSTTNSLGLPSQSKEAVAFALLAWLTWNRLPGNIPSATGAAHPAILGKVTYV
jgi:anhydro-N-acetylmuramic acid kinase